MCGFEAGAFVGHRLHSAQPTKKTLSRATGFTLLEILLVLVLMGLAATMVMPKLATGSGAQDLHIASDRLLTLSQAAQQIALMEGRSIGLSIAHNEKSKEYRYDFLTLQKGEWASISGHRMFREITLPADVMIKLTPGASFWQEALEYEASSDTLLEEVVTEAKVKPDIYFWSSGEVTPARMLLCIANGNGKQTNCREILFEETGEVVARDFMED